MATPAVFSFGPFRLDPADASLRRGAKRLPLTPKDLAVLHELVEHAGQLVTKAAMLRAVWPDTRVDEAVLKVCVRRVRRALGDRPESPRFIETAHRLGYRFIAPAPPLSPPPIGPPSIAARTSQGPRRGARPSSIGCTRWPSVHGRESER